MNIFSLFLRKTKKKPSFWRFLPAWSTTILSAICTGRNNRPSGKINICQIEDCHSIADKMDYILKSTNGRRFLGNNWRQLAVHRLFSWPMSTSFFSSHWCVRRAKLSFFSESVTDFFSWSSRRLRMATENRLVNWSVGGFLK